MYVCLLFDISVRSVYSRFLYQVMYMLFFVLFSVGTLHYYVIRGSQVCIISDRCLSFRTLYDITPLLINILLSPISAFKHLAMIIMSSCPCAYCYFIPFSISFFPFPLYFVVYFGIAMFPLRVLVFLCSVVLMYLLPVNCNFLVAHSYLLIICFFLSYNFTPASIVFIFHYM